MRYTTVIDIREFPRLYRSASARLVYLHLALGAGYHDTDRDQVKASFRALAADTGLTLSAVRAALKALMKNGLVIQKDGRLYVRKWCQEQPISTPRRTANEEKKRQQELKQLEAARQREQQQQEEERKDKEQRAMSVSRMESAMMKNGVTFEEILELRKKNGGKKL